MSSKRSTTPLKGGRYYHLYNRGINKQAIFFKEENYTYFLQKLVNYVDPYCDIVAYCLIKNHFHLLVRVKDWVTDDKQKKKAIVSNSLRRFFLTYVQAVNKQEGRTGTLLCQPFRRVDVSNEDYLKFLMFYIHHNPIKHKLCKSFEKYPHSSYNAIVEGKEGCVNVKTALSIFDDNLDNFIDYHIMMKDKAEKMGDAIP